MNDSQIVLGACVALLVLVGIIAACKRGSRPSISHSAEYLNYLQSFAWANQRKRTVAFTRGRCSLLPWLRATTAHHLHYGNLEHERIVRDLVPLSGFAHDHVVHLWICWRTPLRFVLNWWLRLATIATAIWVRPWLRYPVVLLLLGTGTIIVIHWPLILSWAHQMVLWPQAMAREIMLTVSGPFQSP